jgi:hypothetical protein
VYTTRTVPCECLLLVDRLALHRLRSGSSLALERGAGRIAARCCARASMQAACALARVYRAPTAGARGPAGERCELL